VLVKRRDGERLLLTVETPRGAVLATFRERVAEIDLLVDEGDSVSLGLGRYRPFVEDPSVEGVHKAASGSGRAVEPGPATNGEGASPGSGRPRAAPDATSGVARDTAAGRASSDTAAGSVPDTTSGAAPDSGR
jgi:hypothetical protein